jgi:hypothetical protein
LLFNPEVGNEVDPGLAGPLLSSVVVVVTSSSYTSVISAQSSLDSPSNAASDTTSRILLFDVPGKFYPPVLLQVLVGNICNLPL